MTIPNAAQAAGLIAYRAAVAGDAALLRDVLAISSYATVTEVAENAQLRRYIDGWPRTGDFGVVAETAAGETVGAGWVRRFEAGDAPFYFLPEAPNELVIGVLPGARRRGIGAELVRRLIAEAQVRGAHSLSLNVRADNPAVDLYRGAGFRVVKQAVNRVGTQSLIMQRL